MSYANQAVPNGADGERLVRTICYAGLLALPALILFVHLLLVYRA